MENRLENAALGCNWTFWT